jgi:catechol 2,3-dioxygenase-like lactoylglutathione lyase family enzyme
METKTLHRGRLIDHVHLIARDLAASRRFYDAALGAVGRKVEGDGEGYFWSDELFRQQRRDGDQRRHARASRLPGRRPRRRRPLLRRGARRRRQGPRQAGHSRVPPGLLRRLRDRSRRQQHRGVFHGEADKSAESVEITFGK